jgi:hypothetical protein
MGFVQLLQHQQAHLGGSAWALRERRQQVGLLTTMIMAQEGNIPDWTSQQEQVQAQRIHEARHLGARLTFKAAFAAATACYQGCRAAEDRFKVRSIEK